MWREHALRAWCRAGITTGHSVVDLGAGPGFATLDLADVVGPTGSVLAIERSERFAAVTRAGAQARGLKCVQVQVADLLEIDLGHAIADASWCRWVLSFVTDPAKVVAKLRRALKPGGVAVFHEYVDYRAWRLAPSSAAQEHFVTQVMASWRAQGGEPDIGLVLPKWLEENGFVIESMESHQAIARSGDPFWLWTEAFVQTGTDRLVSMGYLSPADAAATLAAWETARSRTGSFTITPNVLEIIVRVPRASAST